MSILPILAAMALGAQTEAQAEAPAAADPAVPSETATETGASLYQECVALIKNDLEAGRRRAQQWVSTGGGADARHCLAIADLESGFPKLAAARLEEIAERKGRRR